jgi:hypothetical protein
VTAAQRIDALADRMIFLELDEVDGLKIRCPAHLLDAVRPSILKHRSEITAYLRDHALKLGQAGSKQPKSTPFTQQPMQAANPLGPHAGTGRAAA